MSYLDAIGALNGRFGGDPSCPSCGKPMAAEDDHGRYRCPGCGYGHDFASGSQTVTPEIPQVTDILPDGTTDLPDGVKARIPGICRLDIPPTGDEADFISTMLDAMSGGPGYYRNADGSIRPLTPEEEAEEQARMAEFLGRPEGGDGKA